MHDEFGGDDDDSKALRHQLYRIAYSFRANTAPVGASAENLISAAVENSDLVLGAAEKLEKIQKLARVLVNDRAQCKNMKEMVMKVISEEFGPGKPFTAYDVTSRIREMVNSSSLVLLDDRDYEEIDVIGNGVTCMTQKVPHQEVRDTIIEIYDNKLFSGMTRRVEKVNDISRFVYTITNPIATDDPTLVIASTNKVIDQQTATHMSSLVQKYLGRLSNGQTT